MALSNYSELQDSILDWMQRTNQSGVVTDWIRLAEADLNRELNALEDDNALSSVESSREVDISAIDMAEPIALFLTDENGDESELNLKALGDLPFVDDAATPTEWAWDKADQKIVFNCPADQIYSLRLVAKQRLALSDANPTNWLLTNHPDVYLNASIVQGCLYNEDYQGASLWEGRLVSALQAVRHELGAAKRSKLRVDPALTSIKGTSQQ